MRAKREAFHSRVKRNRRVGSVCMCVFVSLSLENSVWQTLSASRDKQTTVDPAQINTPTCKVLNSRAERMKCKWWTELKGGDADVTLFMLGLLEPAFKFISIKDAKLHMWKQYREEQINPPSLFMFTSHSGQTIHHAVDNSEFAL